jgi:hypothetical protein
MPRTNKGMAQKASRGVAGVIIAMLNRVMVAARTGRASLEEE